MAVAARPVKERTVSANHRVVAMRETRQVLAGAYLHEGDGLTSGWHSHDLHQLEYAVHGLVEVDTAAGHHLLPSQRAAWIPAGVEHQSIIRTSVRTISVFFEATLVSDPQRRVRVLAVAPLAREMLLHAVRWPIGRHDPDVAADRFFRAMADVVQDMLVDERPLVLPTSPHPVLTAATEYVREHLDTVTIPELSRAVGVSERTLRRLFQAELDTTSRDYIVQARLLYAMILLAQPEGTVLHAATAVGFSNSSAFARAFTQRCGETPSAYRRRMRDARNSEHRRPA
jgi:AraC-like DNA-binding protein/quercetin dioxygenase-like cupin family protein